MSLLLLRGVLLLVLVGSVHNLEKYQNFIPNGNRVPNPCNFQVFWLGVGHTTAEGGTRGLNPFGQDFQAAGRVSLIVIVSLTAWATRQAWTVELCEKDSDNDGRSNGLELGDPDCLWRADSNVPPQFEPIGHPGMICRDNSVKDRYDYIKRPNSTASQSTRSSKAPLTLTIVALGCFSWS